MIVKFVNSIPKKNFFIYRNVVLYFTIKERNLFIKCDADKNNKYVDEAVTRLKNIFNKQ